MEVEVLGAHNLTDSGSRLVGLRVDGWLGVDAGSLSSGLPFEEQLKIKAVLLSHHHFDHIRDIFTLGLFRAYQGSISLYATAPTLQVLTTLLDGRIYPDFLHWPPESPVYRPYTLEPYKAVEVEGYRVLPLPVSHAVPAVGFAVASPQGKSFFYSGDSGPGLTHCWPHISPDLMVLEITGSNRLEEAMRRSGHLTPRLLREELVEFRKLRGYLPPVALLHYTPPLEEEIRREVGELARELGADISLARDGTKLQV
jgi:ribonuclease BN (tRNA processing enzyme)